MRNAVVDYAIGDVQGCLLPLERLLDYIQYDKTKDTLWFVGDLVNRGPDSLGVLRFIKNLPNIRITLGNHDIHLLSAIFAGYEKKNADDTISSILNAHDKLELGHWLRKQRILWYDAALNVVMCHAGIAPIWDLNLAMDLAHELESALSGPQFVAYLKDIYGNEPNYWSSTLTGIERIRAICNYFTRMRFCDENGHLILNYKGKIDSAPSNYYPWYKVPLRKEITPNIVFGHWAALEGKSSYKGIYPIDTGCYWGGATYCATFAG